MNFHVGKRRSVATVLGALAVLGVGLVLALGVRSVVADPNSGPAGSPPNPGHSWSEIGDLPGTMWHSNNDGAGSGLDADLLDGLDSTAFSTGPHTTSLPWTSITSKPAGFADDVDDDILGGLSCANGQIAKWDGSAWQCAADDTGAGGGYWTQAGLDLYPNNPNWNVGVGTTSPSHKLTISSADESPDEYALRLIGPDGGGLGYGARFNFGDGNYVYIEEDEDDRLYMQASRTAIMGGNVGIGLTTPDAKLHVMATSGYAGFFGSGDDHFDLGLGGAVGRINTDPAYSSSDLYLSSNRDVIVKLDNDSGEDGVLRVKNSGGVDVCTVEESGNLTLYHDGSAVVELGTGLDYAEGFDVSDEAGIGPGTVLVIDAETTGKLAISEQAYDPKVVGVVSGANGLDSAVRVGGDQFDYDVALAGRVYCNVDASYGEVSPGDLLTTSPTPGYAMVVKDSSRAQGAILGKAMEGLGQGEKGQILILVTLQ